MIISNRFTASLSNETQCQNPTKYNDIIRREKTMKTDLETFFKPKSVAVVGASKNPTKIGHAALKNILISDYDCKLYPVNPNEDEILGLKCYKKITDIPGPLDLVLISIPAPLVNKDEFVRQVEMHAAKVEELFGKKPTTFRNTELIYSDKIGEMVADMGFHTILTEGAKHILGWNLREY